MILPNLSQQFNKGTLLLVFLVVIMGLQVFQIWKGNKPSAPLSAVPLASTTPVEIFSNQTASIRGKITSINGQKMTIENDQKVRGDFDAGRVVLINDSTNLTVASSSADLQKVGIGKEAVINLLYVDGRYLVTSLTYR